MINEGIMKLTNQQNMVINCLQNGFVLVTDSEHFGAAVADKKGHYLIGSRLFNNLVRKELICQEFSWPFDYVLTIKGNEINTKDVLSDVMYE